MPLVLGTSPPASAIDFHGLSLNLAAIMKTSALRVSNSNLNNRPLTWGMIERFG